MSFFKDIAFELLYIIVFAVIFIIFYALYQEIAPLYLRKKSILSQLEQLKFKYSEKQWDKNIKNSNFLKNLYGNWESLHGSIVTVAPDKRFSNWYDKHLPTTGIFNNYEIEIFEFTIENKKKKSVAGPYTGIHYNLRNSYPEVDIIYKKSDKLNKLISLLTKNKTIKPKTWDTESRDFNELFSILSRDQVVNLTALTPDVMAQMIDSGLKLNIEIIDNHLLIYTASKFKKGDELPIMLKIGNRIAENLE